MCSRRPRNPRPQSVKTKGSYSLSNSEDFTLQHQDVRVLPLTSDDQSLKMPSRQSGKCAMYSTSAKYNSCQKPTDTVYKCKSFFKNLKYKNNYSRKASEASLLKATRAKEVNANIRHKIRIMINYDLIIIAIFLAGFTYDRGEKQIFQRTCNNKKKRDEQ